MKLRLHSYAVTRSTGRLLLALLLSLYLASKSIERNGERENRRIKEHENQNQGHTYTQGHLLSAGIPLLPSIFLLSLLSLFRTSFLLFSSNTQSARYQAAE